MTAESRHSLPSRTFSGGHAVSNYKELEDMNLVDNFLFGTAVSNEEYGTLIAGTILETIFQREIRIKKVQSEKVVWPTNPELHGIRLDAYIEEEVAAVELGNIYDIEPEKKSGEKTLLPKRCRYYHSRIDENQLKAGKEYYLLPTVWVIFITTFDPFSENRMVYTIRRLCVEEPDMLYDDGESTLFLYTKGTKGNPPDDLRELLSVSVVDIEFTFHGFQPVLKPRVPHGFLNLALCVLTARDEPLSDDGTHACDERNDYYVTHILTSFAAINAR